MLRKAWRGFVRLLSWVRDRFRSLGAWAEVAKVFEAAAATVALVAGAWWFNQQRQTYPRANLEQSVQVVPVDRGLVAIEIHARFANTGNELIHLTDATVMLQNVAASPYDFRQLANLEGPAYWRAKRPIATPDPRQFMEGELRWPVLNEFDGPIEHRVEPGETDVLVFTFIINCVQQGGSPLHWIRVASDVKKPNDPAEKDFAWKARSFADLSEVCGLQRGV